DLEQIRVFTDAWYHVTRYGGFISSHNHPNASWSAVYMVNPGSLAKDNSRTGVLSFKDPRPAANMYWDPGNDRWQRQFRISSVNHELNAGELLVFPSYLMHEVSPYFGELPRLTVAANCSFKRL
ncbi:MAG TPA: putative 2OG-Fe(II) oxygenase, partial [Xanthomonadales bacterium]|nr:putative 2OG-Fe(II) oxygenase [Xanthomonadales bacterium]